MSTDDQKNALQIAFNLAIAELSRQTGESIEKLKKQYIELGVKFNTGLKAANDEHKNAREDRQ